MCLRGVVDSFDLGGEYSIVEVTVPERYVGQTLLEVGFRRKYNLVVLTTIKKEEKKNLIGVSKTVNKVQGVASPKTLLEKDDIMVIYGHNNDIKAILRE